MKEEEKKKNEKKTCQLRPDESAVYYSSPSQLLNQSIRPANSLRNLNSQFNHDGLNEFNDLSARRSTGQLKYSDYFKVKN